MGFGISKAKEANQFIVIFPYRSEEDENGKEVFPLPTFWGEDGKVHVVEETIREVGFVCVYPGMKVRQHLDKLYPTEFIRDGQQISFKVGGDEVAAAKYVCSSIIKDWKNVDEDDGTAKTYSWQELFDLWDKIPELYTRFYIVYRTRAQEIQKREEEEKKKD